MEVVKHGNLHNIHENPDKFVTECCVCGCVYVYSGSEAIRDPRERDCWTNCPECGSINNHSGFNFYKDGCLDS